MFFDVSGEIKIDAYQKHQVFGVLDDLIDFYDSFSFGNVASCIFQGIEGWGNIDAAFFSSMCCTLKSIRMLLKEGYINDAYTLLRKFDDEVIINIYIETYVKEHYSINNLFVPRINNWVKRISKMPQVNAMIEYIKGREELKTLNSLIDFDKKENSLQKYRQRCNDNAHLNSAYFMVLNDNTINLMKKVRQNELEQFRLFLISFFIFHFVYMFYLKPEYFSSSDYLDALESGQEPEEGSQYWVAPFAQEIFEKYVKAYKPDLADYLKDNSFMDLE